jgi:hypothetical protein
MLTQEKPDETGATVQTCPSKLLVQLAQQTGVSTPAAQNATKLMHLFPNKTAIFH